MPNIPPPMRSRAPFAVGLFLLVLLVRFAGAWASRRGAREPAAGPVFARPAPKRPAPAATTLALQRADFRRFEQLLSAVQVAWSSGDPDRLRALATPEMVGVFSEQLATLAGRGQRNVVGNVRLEKGDLVAARIERGCDRATVAMRFSMTDVTLDARGDVVDGSATERVSVLELWTFVRAPGGVWLLSAIGQEH